MAVDRISPTRRPLGLAAGVQWLAYHLFSLEILLVLFLYGRSLKNIMPGTPMPETVFYGVLSIVVGSWVILREGVYQRGLPIVVAGLTFSGWMFAAYGWSPSSFLARESLTFIMGINLWALFVAACVVAGSRERVMRLLLLIVLVTTIIAFSGAYIEVVHGSFRFYRGPDGSWDPRTYLTWGYIVATGAAIVMAIAAHSRFGSVKQLLALLILGVSFFFVMASGARGPTLAIVLAGLVALLVTTPQVRDGRIEIAKTQLALLTVVVLLLGYVAYLLATGQSTSTLGRLMRLLDEASDPLLRRGPNRFDYFAGAWRAWLAAPILGQGLYGFSIYFCGFEQAGCYPHNAFLHILADFGVVGLVLFLTLLYSAIRHLDLKRLRCDPLMVTLAMAFVTVLFNVMVATDIATNFVFFFFLGLLVMRPPPEAEDDGEEHDRDLAGG